MIIKRCGVPALLKTTPDNNNALYALFFTQSGRTGKQIIMPAFCQRRFIEVGANGRRDK